MNQIGHCEGECRHTQWLDSESTKLSPCRRPQSMILNSEIEDADCLWQLLSGTRAQLKYICPRFCFPGKRAPSSSSTGSLHKITLENLDSRPTPKEEIKRHRFSAIRNGIRRALALSQRKALPTSFLSSTPASESTKHEKSDAMPLPIPRRYLEGSIHLYQNPNDSIAFASSNNLSLGDLSVESLQRPRGRHFQTEMQSLPHMAASHSTGLYSPSASCSSTTTLCITPRSTRNKSRSDAAWTQSPSATPPPYGSWKYDTKGTLLSFERRIKELEDVTRKNNADIAELKISMSSFLYRAQWVMDTERLMERAMASEIYR